MQIGRWPSSRRDSTATWCRLSRLYVTAVVLVAATGLMSAQVASDGRSTVYVIPIDGVIDLGLAPYVERTLAEAAAQQAAAVVLDVNTFGGRVDAAVLIRDALLRTPVRTVAFVNKRATRNLLASFHRLEPLASCRWHSRYSVYGRQRQRRSFRLPSTHGDA